MASLVRISAVVFLLFPILAAAQPTAIGPPAPSSKASGELAVSILTQVVRGRAQATVDETNAGLRQQGSRTRVAVESLTALGPSRSHTNLFNVPNSWYAGIPYSLTIKVAIPQAFDRHIHVPIDVRVFCDNWHTRGNVAVRAIPGPASIEGGSILEDIIQIRNLIDSRVRNSFSAPMPVSISLPGRCSSIGGFDNGTATVADDTIVWDVPRLPQFNDVIRQTVVVTFDRLKRLRARTFANSIVYRETEEIALNAFANYSPAFKALTMREGDDVALNLPAIRLDAQTFDSLVVIGSIDQPPNDPRDSAFAAVARAQGFGSGTHVLQISKRFSEIDQKTHKPVFSSVPAYELRYTVQFIDPNVVKQ